MTPKEKATQLFYKFSSFNTYGLDKECCKKSATFLADEIIADGVEWANLSTEQYDYWDEVKKEIQII